MKINHKSNYAERRAAEYPDIKDQLDYLVKYGAEAYQEMMQAIKDRYPKPQGE